MPQNAFGIEFHLNHSKGTFKYKLTPWKWKGGGGGGVLPLYEKCKKKKGGGGGALCTYVILQFCLGGGGGVTD